MGKPHPKGIQGEDIAARYLSGKGYDVRERNVHYRGGELDIVAFDPAQKELVFVEVKSRSSRLFGWPEEAHATKAGSRPVSRESSPIPHRAVSF